MCIGGESPRHRATVTASDRTGSFSAPEFFGIRIVVDIFPSAEGDDHTGTIAFGSFAPLPSKIVVVVALAATTSPSFFYNDPEVEIVVSVAAHSMQHGMAVSANTYQVFHRSSHSRLELR